MAAPNIDPKCREKAKAEKLPLFQIYLNRRYQGGTSIGLSGILSPGLEKELIALIDRWLVDEVKDGKACEQSKPGVSSVTG